MPLGRGWHKAILIMNAHQILVSAAGAQTPSDWEECISSEERLRSHLTWASYFPSHETMWIVLISALDLQDFFCCCSPFSCQILFHLSLRQGSEAPTNEASAINCGACSERMEKLEMIASEISDRKERHQRI
ncbi:hypothetical protein CEXT_481211 [Caerostris extrusa]|uniref:Uncharacterized protein n=1 Tax=Caerostris extrusa TaxID=172846 RepID=A0AAV4NQB9_CAEEX|nr:hypothetical protein CEXT_481211 [Caerostris extrusa]